MKEYKFALVGATGLVGRTAIQVMEEMKLPFSKITFFASERSAGKTITFDGKDYIVQELTESSFDEGFDFAVFSAGGETAKSRSKERSREGEAPRERAGSSRCPSRPCSPLQGRRTRRTSKARRRCP